MGKARTAVGIAIFRSRCGDEVKEHWHRIFDPKLIELAENNKLVAVLLAKKDCERWHGSLGECVEIWRLLHLAPGEESNFTVLIPQDVRYRAPHLPDDLFIPS